MPLEWKIGKIGFIRIHVLLGLITGAYIWSRRHHASDPLPGLPWKIRDYKASQNGHSTKKSAQFGQDVTRNPKIPANLAIITIFKIKILILSPITDHMNRYTHLVCHTNTAI